MQPLDTYAYLTRSRRQLLDAVRPLSAAQYAQEFPIGLRSLARTLTHIMISEWYYVQRLQQREVPPYDEWPIRWQDPPPFPHLETAWSKQATDTRCALSATTDWSASIEYRVTNDDGEPIIVTTSAAGLATQLVLHEVHHRAQAMNMLRHLGIALQDLDYNLLMFHRRKA